MKKIKFEPIAQGAAKKITEELQCKCKCKCKCKLHDCSWDVFRKHRFRRIQEYLIEHEADIRLQDPNTGSVVYVDSLELLALRDQNPQKYLYLTENWVVRASTETTHSENLSRYVGWRVVLPAQPQSETGPETRGGRPKDEKTVKFEEAYSDMLDEGYIPAASTPRKTIVGDVVKRIRSAAADSDFDICDSTAFRALEHVKKERRKKS